MPQFLYYKLRHLFLPDIFLYQAVVFYGVFVASHSVDLHIFWQQCDVPKTHKAQQLIKIMKACLTERVVIETCV